MAFIKDLFCNPDGSGSTKRTAGWLLIVSAITYGFLASLVYKDIDFAIFSVVFSGFMAGGLSCFGLSSFDASAYFNMIGRGLNNNQNNNNNVDYTPTNPNLMMNMPNYSNTSSTTTTPIVPNMPIEKLDSQPH